MSQTNFPWNTDDKRKDMEDIFEELPQPKQSFYNKIKAYIPALLCVFFIGVIVINNNSKDRTKQVTKHRAIDVLVSVLPQNKGQRIKVELLKEIPIRSNDLSKKEKLILLSKNDLEKFSSKVYLKRNLEPRKPITWKDLVYKEKSTPKTQAVFFRGEKK